MTAKTHKRVRIAALAVGAFLFPAFITWSAFEAENVGQIMAGFGVTAVVALGALAFAAFGDRT